jgi:protein phosphatase
VTLAVRSAALSDIGLHRETNEDAYEATPPLFAVADGMGGALAGEVAAGIAIATLREIVSAGGALRAAAAEANARIFSRAQANADSAGMGTTLTAFVLDEEKASGHFVHIGDSRAYLLRTGRLQQLSEDHSLVGEWLREGAITAEEAAVNRYRSVLSRALGTEPAAEIDEFVVDLEDGDVLLLCSDGLSGPVPGEVIAKLLGNDDPGAATRDLIREAKRRGGHDNITAVVVRLRDDASTRQAADGVDTVADGKTRGRLPADDATTGQLVADDATTGQLADAAEGAVVNRLGPSSAGSGAVESPAKSGRSAHWRRRLLISAAVLIVLLVALSLALNQVYYVGTAGGYVAVYRGLPWQVAGIGMHTVYLKTLVPLASLSPRDQQHVNGHSLSSRGAAMHYVGRLEGAP